MVKRWSHFDVPEFVRARLAVARKTPSLAGSPRFPTAAVLAVRLYPPPAADCEYQRALPFGLITLRSDGFKPRKKGKARCCVLLFFLAGGGFEPPGLAAARSPRGENSPPGCFLTPLGRSLRSLPPGHSPFGLITRRMRVQFHT